jgi:hypothetical protein
MPLALVSCSVWSSWKENSVRRQSMGNLKQRNECLTINRSLDERGEYWLASYPLRAGSIRLIPKYQPQLRLLVLATNSNGMAKLGAPWKKGKWKDKEQSGIFRKWEKSRAIPSANSRYMSPVLLATNYRRRTGRTEVLGTSISLPSRARSLLVVLYY